MDGVPHSPAALQPDAFRYKAEECKSGGKGMKMQVEWLKHQYEDLVQGGGPRKGGPELHTDYSVCNSKYRNEAHFLRLGHHLERCINYINGRPHVVRGVEIEYLDLVV